MPVERQASCAVVFADMSGSTKLYVEIGDDAARQVVAGTLNRWSALAAQQTGRVVQLRGDGMLCTFPTIDTALVATMAMRDLPYPPSLSMHAGIHVGPVLQEGEQLYGDVVNVAARMSDVAKRFEVVITEAAFAQLGAARQPLFRAIRNVPIKGKPEPMNIYLLPSPGPMVTELYSVAARSTNDRLQLRFGDCVVIVDGKVTQCLIGRDDECLIKVEHRLVSRRHASVEFKAGRFFLQDHSTNGTYVKDSGQPALVQREIYQLKGRGVISLGVEPGENLGGVIHFTTTGD